MLEPIHLEKILFLREDYPELFTSIGLNNACPVKPTDLRLRHEKALSTHWSETSTVTVSSVALPKADLDLIDALVDAGLFENRSEGIAYFTRKGIEASAEWGKEVRKMLDEIKRLKKEAEKKDWSELPRGEWRAGRGLHRNLAELAQKVSTRGSSTRQPKSLNRSARLQM
ncbi:MAG: ribbon-helix-helix domain-containing protein [Thermoproteota archaeon]